MYWGLAHKSSGSYIYPYLAPSPQDWKLLNNAFHTFQLEEMLPYNISEKIKFIQELDLWFLC